MATQTKGFCKYCGKEYTKGGMLRHLQACSKRKIRLDSERGKRRCRYFEIVILDKYRKAYWLIVEASENTTLKTLDQFIRDIWVECCGHLSAFECNGIQYESTPDPYWDEDSKNMNYRLKDVVEVGDSISYAYDFGSTTELILNIHSCRDGEKKDNKIVILSRNNPPKIMCSNCEQNEAKWINPMGYDYGFFWCDKCLKENQENEEDEEAEALKPEYFLPICNSPRMGICGYDGSHVYPDQFKPDEE